jgi:hypothetical protein
VVGRLRLNLGATEGFILINGAMMDKGMMGTSRCSSAKIAKRWVLTQALAIISLIILSPFM